MPQQAGRLQFLPQRSLWGFLLAVALWAVVGTLQASQAEAGRALDPAVFFRTTLPLAFHGSAGVGDFDGDRHTDFAVAQPQGLVNGVYRYRVEVLLSARPLTAFDIDSGTPGGLHISTRDVDGDLDLDLVITSEFGREPVGVWINDGNGQFTHSERQNYPASIWHETAGAYEAPEAPVRSLPAFVVPTSGASVALVRFALPTLADTTAPLATRGEGCSRKALNSSSRLRAPPPLF